MDKKTKNSALISKKQLLIACFIFFVFVLLNSASCRKRSQNNYMKNGNNVEVEEPRVKDNVTLNGENVGGLSQSEVLRIISEKSSEMDKDEENASINRDTWEIKPEKPGQKVNIEETLQDVLNAGEYEDVKLKVYETVPHITESIIAGNIVKIAEYTTPIVDNNDSRMNNIELAIDKINNLILDVGEEFSFNNVVGKRTEEKGYEYAPIIIRTDDGPKKEDGIGGGICQLSTTIFNAVEECELEITERHTHSSDVTYVPQGEDAAVSYGSIDFKFKNNRDYPIILKIYIDKKSLTVKIFENKN